MKLANKNGKRILLMSEKDWMRIGQNTGWRKAQIEVENEPEPAGRVVRIERYGKYWAVYVDDKLLCVTVYLKGAEAVKGMVERVATSD